MKNHTKYTALITSSLLIVALAGPANATEPEINKEPTTGSQPVTLPPVSADIAAVVSFEKPAVKAYKPLPVVAPVVAPQVKPQSSTPAPAPTAPPSGKVTTPAPELQPVAPVSASDKGAALAAAAYAQIGIAQDCTRMVSNALATVGIKHHGWPASYAALGTPVATPAPGDILIYANAGAGVAHVAIYVGNGMAVHGGFNGSTVLFKANVGTGYRAIRVA